MAALVAFAQVPAAGARVAGGSGNRTDCYSEFDGITAVPNSRPPRVECVDGDPCDTDGVCGNGFCEFKIRLCVNQDDPAIPICKALHDGLLRLHVAPRRFAGLAQGLDLGKSSCGAVVPVAVATHFGPFGPDRPGRQSLRVLAVGRGAIPTADSDNVTLLCRPRPANRPGSRRAHCRSTSSRTRSSRVALPSSIRRAPMPRSRDASGSRCATRRATRARNREAVGADRTIRSDATRTAADDDSRERSADGLVLR